MDRLELRRRVDAELVGQPGPQPRVRPEGVGLGPSQGQGPHQLAAEALRQRMAGHQLLELGHQPVGGAGGQVGLDPVLDGLQAQPVQAGDGRLGEGGGGRIGQGRASPQGQGLAQQGPRPVRVAAQLLAAGQGQCLEADGVHGLGVHGQPVAARRGLEHPREQTPQPGDERLQGVGRPRRRVVVPDRVDQLGRGHHPPRVEGQAQQQPAQPRPGHLDGQARTGPHLQRAQDGDAQAAGHAPILPPAGSSGRSGRGRRQGVACSQVKVSLVSHSPSRLT